MRAAVTGADGAGRRVAARPLRAARPRASHSSAVPMALGLFVALTLGAELVVRALHVAPYVFPPPSAVLAELAADPLLFARAALVTVSEAAAGLVLGAALASSPRPEGTRCLRLSSPAAPASRSSLRCCSWESPSPVAEVARTPRRVHPPERRRPTSRRSR